MTRWQLCAWWTLLSTLAMGLASSLFVDGTHESQDVVIFSFVAYAAVGAVVTRRRPGNTVGWIFLGVGALTGVASFAATLVEGADPRTEALTVGQVFGAWVENWFWFPLFMLATTFTILLFPEGLPSRRWRPVLWSATFSTVAATLSDMFASALPVGESGQRIDNPLSPWSASGAARVESSPLLALPVLLGLLCGLAAVVSIVLRFRRAEGVERAQLRWFAAAVILVAVSFALGSMSESQLAALIGESAAALVVNTVFALSLGVIPIACGIAITRNGLYEIDRILSRTVSYSVVTGVVLLTYVVVVTSVSRLLPSSSELAVAGATLAAAAAIRPVLSRVQNHVDRRFNRARFDAVHEVDAFSTRLRSSVNTQDTLLDLEATVGRTLAPAAIGVWMPQGGDRQ